MNPSEIAKLKEELSRLDLENRDPFNVYRRALDCIEGLEERIEEMEDTFNDNYFDYEV